MQAHSSYPASIGMQLALFKLQSGSSCMNVSMDSILKGRGEKRENLNLNAVIGMRCGTEVLTSLIFIKNLLTFIEMLGFYSLNKKIRWIPPI